LGKKFGNAHMAACVRAEHWLEFLEDKKQSLILLIFFWTNIVPPMKKTIDISLTSNSCPSTNSP
jgi:hypothetical protein